MKFGQMGSWQRGLEGLGNLKTVSDRASKLARGSQSWQSNGAQPSMCDASLSEESTGDEEKRSDASGQEENINIRIAIVESQEREHVAVVGAE